MTKTHKRPQGRKTDKPDQGDDQAAAGEPRDELDGRLAAMAIADAAARSTAWLLGGGSDLYWYGGVDRDADEQGRARETLAAFLDEHRLAPVEALYRTAAEARLHDLPIDDWFMQPFWFRMSYRIFRRVYLSIREDQAAESAAIAETEARERGRSQAAFAPPDDGEGTFLERQPSPLTPSSLGKEAAAQHQK